MAAPFEDCGFVMPCWSAFSRKQTVTWGLCMDANRTIQYNLRMWLLLSSVGVSLDEIMEWLAVVQCQKDDSAVWFLGLAAVLFLVQE